MIVEILRDYGKAFLWTDGYHYTGVVITLWLLVASLSIGLALAIPLAVARASNDKVLSGAVLFYTYIFRGVPLYVQLLIIYSGIYSLSYIRGNELLNGFFREGINCTILAFALCTCAYTTEIIAGAIKSIPVGQVEAAKSFGMSPFTLYRRIIIPAALRRALPAYSNEVILMLHSTSLAFTATVPDILKVARDANSATYASFESFSIAGALYATIAFALIWAFRNLERRWLSFLKT
jgi:histidine transport system permease protein